jgi:HD-GYP domain-containing protein (c-di-GMP phosphodiesterase class II)/DNA-binding CsgD family transcriptional regulator
MAKHVDRPAIHGETRKRAHATQVHASRSTLRSVPASERDDGVTLAELLAAFSLATDLGLGQPMEHVLRSWRIAARLGEHVGLDDDEQASLFYIAVLAWVGCVADTPEVARWFGDDIAFRSDSYQVELTGLSGLGFMLGHVGAGDPAVHRLRLAATLVATGGKGVERGLLSHCLTTSKMAELLGMGPQVCGALQQFFTRWDGKGMPRGIGREDIATSVRLFHVADIVEVYYRTGGVDAAVEVARARRGSLFDPAVVDAFCAVARDVLDDSADQPDWHDLISSHAGLQHRLTGRELDSALEVVADFTDLRSAWRAGHSRGVAGLASEAAQLAGLPAAEVTAVRRAGLLHDIGLHGVPATILDKPGALTRTESERMRIHAYYTERVLARPAALARLGAIAALTHERLDGSGYHRGLSGAAISSPARILAAADAYRAMTEPRPYRPALSAKQATAALLDDVRGGRLASVAADAVLTAAGGARHPRRTGPAGLTPREVEVLVLIARGASTRQVGRALDISTKTAGTHIERIYSKTHVSTRSTATLFALQHGLLDTLEALDS